MDAINERADQFICLPSPQQQAIIAEEIEERRSFPHCVGFLDGSLIPIPKPKVWLCMLEKRWRLNQNILKKILTHVLQGLRNRLHHAQEPARDEFPIFGGFQICHSWCSFRYGKHFFLIHVVFFSFSCFIENYSVLQGTREVLMISGCSVKAACFGNFIMEFFQRLVLRHLNSLVIFYILHCFNFVTCIQMRPLILEKEDGSEIRTSGYILGDQAYPLSPFLQIPYSRKWFLLDALLHLYKRVCSVGLFIHLPVCLFVTFYKLNK